MIELTAAVAEAHGTPALVDRDGCVWLGLADGGWTYLARECEVSWDIHDRLPALYEPYRALDRYAAAALAKAAGVTLREAGE